MLTRTCWVPVATLASEEYEQDSERPDIQSTFDGCGPFEALAENTTRLSNGTLQVNKQFNLRGPVSEMTKSVETFGASCPVSCH